MPQLSALSLKKRHPEWLKMYPSGPFWQAWHLGLIGHQPAGFPTPITLAAMRTLWNTSTVNTPAGGHLQRFESVTLFGGFPPRTTIASGWRNELANIVLLQGLNGWYNLRGHYDKHAAPGSSELPALNAAARALQAYAQAVGVPTSLLSTFFLGWVDDLHSYGTLALSAWFASRLPENGFEYLLHSPDAPAMHSLNLNLYIPPTFIQQWVPAAPARGVLVGVGVASAYSLGAGLYVPKLLPQLVVSTVFSPSGPPTRTPGFTMDIDYR